MHARAIAIILIVTASLFIIPAYASSVTITVQKEQTQVHSIFALTLNQNMTQLPIQTSTLNQGTDQQLASAFAEAVKKSNASATPEELAMNIVSSNQSLAITATMNVSGVSERRGDILTVDMSWKSLNVSADLRAGNLSYNTIGRRYFRPIVQFYANASRFVGRPNATITGVSFIINRTSVGPETAENYVGNFTIFDFTELGSPLDNWVRTYSLSNDTTTWRLTPLQRLDFLMAIQRQNRTMEYSATYAYDAEITVFGLARAQGNILIVETGTGGQEWAMLGILVIAIVLAITAQLLFRARRKKYAKFGRRYP